MTAADVLANVELVNILAYHFVDGLPSASTDALIKAGNLTTFNGQGLKINLSP